MYLTGEFSERQSIGAAIERLKAQGRTPEDLAIFSTEPVELDPGILDRPSRMSLAAVSGAISLCLLAAGFVWYTQRDYPLITGGMPLFSFWATGVVFYEMTMLGAIVTIFLMFLWESGLLRRREGAPVPVLEPGRVYLRVHCEPDEISAIGECLYKTGANRVQKLGGRL